jgi:hypothetical protein
MNEATSKVDSKLKVENQALVKERVDFNVHNHHRTELLDENYREIYKVDFKPQRNSKVTNR